LLFKVSCILYNSFVQYISHAELQKSEDKLMANFIKSKVQQSLSFLLMLVITFSIFSEVILINPSPSYAYNQTHLDLALRGYQKLGQADLSQADLSGTNLSKTILSKSNLDGANLSGANLSAAFLGGASLIGASLSKADLQFANLRGADLRGADLTEALLNAADLEGAIANSKTRFPKRFDAIGRRVIFRN
jgi:uncharacterized protein YjbI with pentapeptide repeats